MTPIPPSVLLVEDDASIARFVQLALEGLPIALHSCTSAEQAQRLLERQHFALLITDLMLPGASGIELIEWLRCSAQAACRAVVFSAGVHAEVERQLQQLQVWRVLRKPVSVAKLVECVESALAAAETLQQEPAAQVLPQADAIASFFGGDADLFRSYRASCLAQLPVDVAQAGQLLALRDAAALRRLAHSLKSVLRLLGQERAAGQAQILEQACLAGDWREVEQAWRPLDATLRAIVKPYGATGTRRS